MDQLEIGGWNVGVVRSVPWFSWGVSSNEALSYALVSTTPRSPRVIIVIDGGEHWSYWVRRALYRAHQVWGGGGFAVVPHRSGRVNPVLLRGCEAYDPDFVVTYSPTVEDVEHFNPGCIRMTGEDGEPLTGADRQRMLEMVHNQDVPSGLDEAGPGADRHSVLALPLQAHGHRVA